MGHMWRWRYQPHNIFVPHQAYAIENDMREVVIDYRSEKHCSETICRALNSVFSFTEIIHVLATAL